MQSKDCNAEQDNRDGNVLEADTSEEHGGSMDEDFATAKRVPACLPAGRFDPRSQAPKSSRVVPRSAQDKIRALMIIRS